MTRVWKWNRPVTVREVLEDIQQERSIAYTTVMTVMDNLHQKGWVRRQAEGRAYRYQAVSTRAAYSAALMNDAWSRSDNPAAALVAFFGMMSPGQREALRDAVRMVQDPDNLTNENGADAENPSDTGDAPSALNAENPENPENAGNADKTENAGNADKAENAGNADKAENAGNAANSENEASTRNPKAAGAPANTRNAENGRNGNGGRGNRNGGNGGLARNPGNGARAEKPGKPRNGRGGADADER